MGNEWLLEEKDKDILCEDYPLLDLSFEDDYREEVEVLLKAQDAKTKKKMLAWLENVSYRTFARDKDLHVDYAAWQALRKEVGLEEK